MLIIITKNGNVLEFIMTREHSDFTFQISMYSLETTILFDNIYVYY